MKVCLITATKNRHKQLERVVRFVLDQTSKDYTHLIYNNSPRTLRLGKELDGRFLLINNHLDKLTGQPYSNLGDIYRDAMLHVPEDCDVVSFADDDDIYFQNHVEEGLKGLERGGLTAYKPQKSWFRYGQKLDKVENNLEPSVFVKTEHIQKYGFGAETTAQHLKWLDALVQTNQIFVDPNGPLTYLCDWSQTIPTFKTSGDPNNPNNFNNYDTYSKDNGDGIITPCSESWANHYRRL